MESKINDFDTRLLEFGLKTLSTSINDYLGTNYPTNEHRALLEYLFTNFPEFVYRGRVFRAIRDKSTEKKFKNKYVSGCLSKSKVEEFVEKRRDKGYEFILESKEAVDYFDFCKFIELINDEYGKFISTRYLDEEEIIFKFTPKCLAYKYTRIHY